MRKNARLLTLGFLCGLGGFVACGPEDGASTDAGSDAGVAGDTSIPMDGTVQPVDATLPDAEESDANDAAADTSATHDTGTDATGTDATVADSGDAGADSGSDAADSATVDADADADAGPPGPVTVTSRNVAGGLASQTWAAWQDGNGAWTALTPTSTGTYVFLPTAATYGVAFDCAAASNLYADGVIYYRRSTTVQLDITAGGNCAPVTSPSSQALSGNLTNLLATTSYIRTGQSDGNRTASLAISGSSAPYNTFSGFFAGKTYDIAIGIADNAALLKMLFVRGQVFGAADAGANLTRDVDWAVEGFLPAGQNTVTISNANASTTTSVVYAIGGSEQGIVLNKGAGSAGSHDFTTVPAGQQLATDHYAALVADYPANGMNTVQRFFHDAANVTLALPPSINATFDLMLTSPYVRPTFALQAMYAGAQTYTFSWTYYVKQVSSRSFTVDVDPAWLSGAAPYVLAFPAFSGIAGWNDAWAPPPPVDAGAGAITTSASVSSKNVVGGGYEKLSSQKYGSVP